MKDDKKLYVVYRKSPDAQFYHSPYGWTFSKKILKAFLKQRKRSKYHVVHCGEEELLNAYRVTSLEEIVDVMINWVNLYSTRLGVTTPFFTTSSEMNDTEVAIHKMFRQLCTLENVDSKNILLLTQMVAGLDEEYADALRFLGYRPPEIDILFDDVESSFDNSITMIDNAYRGQPCEEAWIDRREPVVKGHTDDTFGQIIISLESFIMILRDEL